MKLTVTLVLLVAAAHAAEVQKTRSQQKTEDGKTDKRELAEGNAGIEKRAPVLPTVSPAVTPGIEYAETKESQPEKSPSQIYATPVPQISKISDLLTAQGPPFQAAIASHLLAPVSVYQPRLAAPTTYEVSSPIASQLAYSEHKISYQPPQNAIQYQPVQYNQKVQAPKQANFARPINFHQPYQQQIFAQPQPVVYSQPPQLVPIPQPVQYQQIPFQVQRPLYTQQNVFPQHIVSQPAYNQEQALVQVSPSVQPGITYASEEESNDQTSQRQLKPSEQSEESQKSVENLTPAPQKSEHGQGAVSYASFSQSQPAPSFAPPSREQYQPRPQQYQAQAQPQQYRVQPQQYQPQPQQYQPQPQQYQPQPQQYQPQPQQYQPQPQQYQIQPQRYQVQPPQYQVQPQQFQIQPIFQNQPQQQPSQYEIQIQYQTPENSVPKAPQEIIATAATKSLPVNPQRPVSYFRPGPVLQQIQPQYQQGYPQGQVLLRNPGHIAPQSAPVPPSFPPVQYFGKFAQSIFGGVQH